MVGMPRREILRAVVVLAVAMVGLASWLDVLREFGAGNREMGTEALWGVLLWSLLAWGVMRNPAKWGFRVGVVLTGFVLCVGLFAVGVWWVGLTRPGSVEEPFNDIGFWSWLKFWAVWSALAALAVGALSLRRLYRTEVPLTKG